jgi:hypothetical protein
VYEHHAFVVIEATSSCGCRGWIRMKMTPAAARATAAARVRVDDVMDIVALLQGVDPGGCLGTTRNVRTRVVRRHHHKW